jgi:hypothetical protein
MSGLKRFSTGLSCIKQTKKHNNIEELNHKIAHFIYSASKLLRVELVATLTVFSQASASICTCVC